MHYFRSKELVILVFSKDRALQLDACLQSMLQHCEDVDKFPIKILYTTSSGRHEKQYDRLKAEYGVKKNIQFLAQTDFADQVKELLASYRFILFLVDDNLFVNSCSLSNIIHFLETQHDAAGFSLRLGANTSYCYPSNSTQNIPIFDHMGDDIRKFDWTHATMDFAYPYDLSSSVYRTGDILELIKNGDIGHPNRMEAWLDSHKQTMAKGHPYLLCYETSRCFCNPINKVQSVAVANRVGKNEGYNSESLAGLFDRHIRIDTTAYDGIHLNACHQEEPLYFVKNAARTSKDTPLVSVIIPCYNYGEYLESSVESIIQQTYQDFEIIIVNDGSTDNSKEVAEHLISKYSDVSIQLVNQKNTGHPAISRNNGIKKAKGQYILTLDADDKVAPTFIEKTLQVLQANPEYSIAYTHRQDFDGANEVHQAQPFNLDKLRYQNHLSYCALYKKEVWEKVGGYRTNTRFEDWDFFVAAGAAGFNGVLVPEPLFLYRRHDTGFYQDSIKNFEYNYASIVMNNREIYSEKEIEDAERIINSKNDKSKGKRKGPKVSVIVPTHNRVEGLCEAIQSIQNQSFQDFEIIVVNDAGDDVTAVINSFDDKRIRYFVHKKNKGLAAARNTGLKKSRGKYIAYLDDDDIYYFNHLETLVNQLEYSGYRVAYSVANRAHQQKQNDYYVITHRDIPYAYDFSYDRMLISNYIPVLCIMHERRCLKSSGLFDESLNSHEDWDLWIRMGREYPFLHLSKVTCEFRWREDGTSMTSERLSNYLETMVTIHGKYSDWVAGRNDIKNAQYAARKRLEAEIKQKSEVLVSIIIPVFNKWDLTRQCLNYLRKNTPQKHEIIIVDNASTDGTRERLLQLQRDGIVKAVINEDNEGFAKACNKGARTASGSYLLFLNNDTVVHPGWLEAMLKTLDQISGVGIVGSRLVYPDFTIQHAGIAFTDRGLPYHIHRGVFWNDSNVNRPLTMPAVTGACMLMPTNVFNKISGFDESYQMYVEDIDLCLRVWQAGYKVVYCPQSIVTHLESASVQDTEKRDVQVRVAWSKMHERWMGRWPESVLPMLPESLRQQNGNSDYENKPVHSNMRVYWTAPIFNQSGYADEARHFILGLNDAGIPIHGRHIGDASESFICQLDMPTRDKLAGLISTDTPLNGGISIVHAPGYALQRLPGADFHIGRTMFETDRLPHNWVEACNTMNEIWVPSEFNCETFVKAGVSTPVQIVPEGIDSHRYHPGKSPLPIPGVRGTVFLSVFEWIYRKGWDVLLEAWAKAFTADADVSLVLRSYPIGRGEGDTSKLINRLIDEHLIKLGTSRKEVAPIIVLGKQIPEKEMPRLYASADVLVAPSRGEGWGRPQMAGMATGLPVIATGWSGNTSFMNDKNSLLVPSTLVGVDERCEVPFYRGHQWAEPSVEILSEHMRACAESETLRKEIGMQARRDIEEKWDWSKVVGIARKRLEELRSPTAQIKTGSPSVVWEGSQFVTHSLAHVNRSIGKQLLKKGFDLSLIPYEKDTYIPEKETEEYELYQRYGAPVRSDNHVHVRHHWPPNFTPPASGHWVIIQPWEFGSLPEKWIRPMSTLVDEIWVPSDYVKECYVRSGVPEDRVQVVPNGVDVETFKPSAKPYPLKTKKSFKFLFVGGTIGRKGIDVLLDVYVRNFKTSDDVCLVIKDMGGKSFYRGQTAADSIAQLQAHPDAPEIEYIDRELTNDEMAGLYTACNCLVHPYRGEGFGLPIAEAMAAGLPVVVTNHGAALDFCSSGNAYLIDAREVKLKEKAIGDIRTVDHPWWAEPDSRSLANLMKEIINEPDEAKRKAIKARKTILKSFTWDSVGEQVSHRIMEISKKPIRRLQTTTSIKWNSRETFIEYFMQAVRKQQWTELEKETLRASQLYSDDTYIWVLRAINLRILGQYDDAIEAVENSLKIAESPEALYEAIQIAQASGKNEQVEMLNKHLMMQYPGWAQKVNNQHAEV